VDTRRALALSLLVLSLLIGTRSTQAQAATLESLSPSSGVIESGGQQDWRFSGTNGSVISLLAESTGGSLDPAITLLNSQGQALVSNDDYDFPVTTNALLQAITLPANDEYTVRVTGVNGTSGDYNLTLTPGYADIYASETFSGGSGWNTEGGDLNEADGQLTVSVQGALQTATVTPETLAEITDFFVETRITLNGIEGWVVGFIYRDSGDERFLLKVNNRGEWRLEIQAGDERRILRDWTSHPALAGQRDSFRLAVLANSSGMDFFLDGQLFGRATDSSLNDGSGLGLLVETVDSLTSRVVASFDDLIITTPRRSEGATILPQELLDVPPVDLVRDLQRQSVIPAGGELAFNVEESFVESRVPGVESFLLARDSTFGNLVIGGRVTLQTVSPGAAGCGLVFGNTAENVYHLAYVDAAGGLGISGRIEGSFQPGIFAEHTPSENNTHDLLVIAVDGRILYYVDQRLVGQLDESLPVGVVGNAVVNFEPIATSCQFNNTWVWRWENTP
jgi:hypothetical protein